MNLLLIALYFITSFTFSFLVISSQAETPLEYFLAFNITAIFEVCTALFLNNKNKKIATVGMILLFISIFSATNWFQNKENAIINDQLSNSVAYKEIQESKQLNKTLIADKRKQISDLETQYNKDVESINQSFDNQRLALIEKRDKYSNTWAEKTATAKELELLPNKLRNTLDSRLTKFNNQKSNINDQLDNLVSSATRIKEVTMDKAEKGYISSINTIAVFFGWRTETLSLFIKLLMALMLQISGLILIHMTFGKIDLKKDETLGLVKDWIKSSIPKPSEPTNSVQPKEIQKPKVIIPKKAITKKEPVPQAKIGFKINEKESKLFNNEEVRAYLKAMYESKRDGNISRGYKAIGKQIGIKDNKASKIMGHLQHQGIIEVVDGRTHIKKVVKC